MTQLIEIFSGIQGEGAIAGFRQIFIRFAGCQLDCTYCDTTKDKQKFARVEQVPGKRDFVYWENPIEPEKILLHCLDLNSIVPHHSVSFTGGEPLLQIDDMYWLARSMQMKGLPVYLETNGLLYTELTSVLPWIDIISMDIKLQTETNIPTKWLEHMRFLEIACERSLFVKVVVSQNTKLEDIEMVARMIGDCSQSVPLIIQPLTASEKYSNVPPTPERLLEIMDRALQYTSMVRVLPQMHIMIGQL